MLLQKRLAQAHIVYTARRNIVCAKRNLVLCPLWRNDVSLRLNDVASELANDVVSLRTQTQKENTSQKEVFLFGGATRNRTGE